ncbi:periodic tryptophan protein 1 homolog [Cephus cinctus]|uniref:Periodic tryptophan protein 1 homolog n=1 Tax=Cephus cinctus TaxID=211228 RepID=A0AAJ7FFA8_CEPCN|nr:periodic tryptophan protein 1 homolog [Cephus cinctus]
MNVIPCITWVKKGVAAAVPDKVQLTPQELENIIKQTESNIKDIESDDDNDDDTNPTVSKQANSSKGHQTQSDAMIEDEFNFDKYDDEAGNIHCNIGGLAVLNKDGKDPFVTVGDSEDEDSEKEDDIIKDTDNLVLVGHVDGDASILEVHVYNEEEGSFYCHHDILLPSFPLCIEWLNFDSSDPRPGNLCAIGNMTPIIEVWDLDVVDCLEPAFKLGRKPSKKLKLKRVGHRDAVLDLAWNSNYTHVLASGSVDQTVLLWDLENGTPVTKLNSFNEKVQTIEWHPSETQKLLTGCSDKTVRLFDCRAEDDFKAWQTAGEVERVLWNHFDPNYYFASTDNGQIQYVDVRQDNPIWQISAHEKEITGLCLSTSCPGLLVSSCNGGILKVWDVINHNEAILVWEKKANLGALQCLAANPDSPFIFVLGGDNKSDNMKVLNLLTSSAVSDRFKERQKIKLEFGDSQGTQTREVKTNQEIMEVTDEMESVALETSVSGSLGKKKKRNKK